jgi:hypothetical protein
MPLAYSLHGYHPIVIDENCLSDADCKQALLESLHAIASGGGNGDWRNFATPQELAELENVPKLEAPFISTSNESPALREKRSELAHRCRLRAYAIRTHGNGHSIWYGDGTALRSTN